MLGGRRGKGGDDMNGKGMGGVRLVGGRGICISYKFRYNYLSCTHTHTSVHVCGRKKHSMLGVNKWLLHISGGHLQLAWSCQKLP